MDIKNKIFLVKIFFCFKNVNGGQPNKTLPRCCGSRPLTPLTFSNIIMSLKTKFSPKFAFTGGNSNNVEVTEENFKALSSGQQLLVNLCYALNIDPELTEARDGKSRWLSRESVTALSEALFK